MEYKFKKIPREVVLLNYLTKSKTDCNPDKDCNPDEDCNPDKWCYPDDYCKPDGLCDPDCFNV